MKTLCIYHSRDLDGWMSGAVIKHHFNKTNTTSDNTLTSVGWDYGDSVPTDAIEDCDQVIMADISFPKEVMDDLHNRKNLIWIDHHISAMNDIGDHISGLRNDKYAACELTWMHLFPGEKMPELVRLLGRYDCFGHKHTDEETKVLEFQYGARANISGIEMAYDKLKDCLSNPGEYCDSIIDAIHSSGKDIYTHLCTEGRQDYDKLIFPIVFFHNDKLCKFGAINRQRFNPVNFNIDYHADGWDGIASFHWDPNLGWTFSLYNDNQEVDCSVIAKSLGGGGHKGASGFRLEKMEDLHNFIQEHKWTDK